MGYAPQSFPTAQDTGYISTPQETFQAMHCIGKNNLKLHNIEIYKYFLDTDLVIPSYVLHTNLVAKFCDCNIHQFSC